MQKISLDVAPHGHECDCCQSANYRRPMSGEPEYPCTIYALHVGAGYRQPAYMCPDCLAKLRAVLGVSSGIANCNKEEGV